MHSLHTNSSSSRKLAFTTHFSPSLLPKIPSMAFKQGRARYDTISYRVSVLSITVLALLLSVAFFRRLSSLVTFEQPSDVVQSNQAPASQPLRNPVFSHTGQAQVGAVFDAEGKRDDGLHAEDTFSKVNDHDHDHDPDIKEAFPSSSSSTLREEDDRTSSVDASSIAKATPTTNPGKYRHTHCFLYDRPPRTASTTIGLAIKDCLRPYGFQQPRIPERHLRPLYAPTMLDIDAPRVALYSVHFYLDNNLISQVQRQCQNWLYVSSSAPMLDRIWSVAKYKIKGTHGNKFLTEDDVEKAKKYFQRHLNTTEFLNAYPYISGNETALDVKEEERWKPHYVVRKEHVEEDLTKLLEAIGCESKFRSRNVHAGRTSAIQEQLKKEFRFDDYRQRQLERVGPNEEGLKRARLFNLT